MPPATGTAVGMAASAATASSSEPGNVTVCAACGACVVNPGAPSRWARLFRQVLAVRYVLSARTWKLWHIFRFRCREGPQAVVAYPPSGESPGWETLTTVGALPAYCGAC
ncbi:hypothetical protein GCM10010214_36350 [Streptomyces abikoensis]|nr:hypothetical protein GCM10010214_36350 [Streptomyces abikoensis]